MQLIDMVSKADHILDLVFFPEWEVVVSGTHGLNDVKVLSRITATFSVELCVKSEESTGCKAAETRTIHVVGIK